MKKTRNPAFIVELLLLFVILLLVIVVITRTFMAARSQSLSAKHLTEAVSLAENAAEISLSAADPEDAYERLLKMVQVTNAEKEEDTVKLTVDFSNQDGENNHYLLEMNWAEETTQRGAFKNGEIRVYYLGSNENYDQNDNLIYTLNTGEYVPGGNV